MTTKRAGVVDDLLSLLGYEPAPVNLTGQLTGSEINEIVDPDSEDGVVDRLDRVDRSFVAKSGDHVASRFEIGKRYREKTAQVIYTTAAALREEAVAAGFLRAGIVRVDGEALLVDDVVRLMVDGTMMVLGFAVISPQQESQPNNVGRGL